MGIISKLFDFLLYSNVWIAGAAASLYMYSQYLLQGSIRIDTTAIFVFLTCIWLYSLHRFIGLQKVNSADPQNRFYKIDRMRKPIRLLAIASFIGSIILVFTLSLSQIFTLAIPGALSLLYVLPVFKNSKRLRDINYIKIFVISLVWAGLTVALPLADCASCEAMDTQILLFVERFIFIFAITLPFDIRDLEVDKAAQVKTISAKIGMQKTWLVSFFLLSISLLIFTYLAYHNLIGYSILFMHLIINLITLLAIWIAFWLKHDWYYTGLLDGTMYLPICISWVWIFLF